MEKAGDILKLFFDSGQFARGQKYSAFFRSWEHIVGVKLAGHSRIVELHQNNLYVEIDHPGWMQIFLMKERLLLGKIQAQYPDLDIRGIKFKVKYKNYVPKKEKRPGMFQKPEEKREVVRNLKQIKNPELKNLLQGLFQSVINREGSVDKE